MDCIYPGGLGRARELRGHISYICETVWGGERDCMVRNKIGTEIPEHIESAAKDMGLNLNYIYEDGNYGAGFPASNPRGGRRSTHFRNMGSANAQKVIFADNWVYFKSPTYADASIDCPEKLSLEDVPIALRMPPEILFDSDWNLKYGATNTRKSSFGQNNLGRESALNPGSETFLTFFMLTNLDSWQQPDCLKWPIRHNDGKNGIDGGVFTKMRTNHKEQWAKSKEFGFNPCELMPSLKNKDDLDHSVFFFECDIMSSEVNPSRGGAFRDLSFLDISMKAGWAAFDCYIFLPNLKRCIFIESKLGSDIHHTVKWSEESIRISQIIREMEAAFLFTHHPESNFYGWNYDYLFICPRDRYEQGDMGYSNTIREIQNQNSHIVKNAYECLDVHDDSTKQELFEEFATSCHRHIHVRFWDELVALIQKKDPDFISDYMNRLGHNKCLQEAAGKRFELAGIRLISGD